MFFKCVCRDVLCSFRRPGSSTPVAFAIKEIFSDGCIRYLISKRKSYDSNPVSFDSFKSLESYISSRGWY